MSLHLFQSICLSGKKRRRGKPALVAATVIVAMMLSLISGPLRAEMISDLYRVKVLVNSQSAEELRRASRSALAELFVRVSGQAAVLDDSRIANAIKNAQGYTKQFSYERQYDEMSGEQLQLVLEFEPQLIEDTLRRAGLPLWSSNRPTVLVWLAVEDAAGRRFVGVEKDPEIVRAITAHARSRGLAVKLPTLDLTDMVALAPLDIWEQNFSKIRPAVERYAPDTVLIGRITHLNNGRWLGLWGFQHNGMLDVFDDESEAIDSYVAAAIDQVAETLSAQYAIVPSKMAKGDLLLRLTNVNNFVDYARAISYLENVVAIHHANVISLEGDELIIRLVADGELAQLQQAFALDRKLIPQPGNSYAGPYTISLNYRWPSDSQPPVVTEVPPEESEVDTPQDTDQPYMESLQ